MTRELTERELLARDWPQLHFQVDGPEPRIECRGCGERLMLRPIAMESRTVQARWEKIVEWMQGHGEHFPLEEV